MSERRKCPECGVSVKVENLEAHFKKLHPRSKLDPAVAAEAQREARRHRPIRRGATSAEKKVYVASAIVILVVIAVAVGIQQSSQPPSPPVGQPAPDFQLTTTSGDIVQLSSFRGRVVLLDFFSTSCYVCQQFTPDTLAPLYAQHGIHFVLLSIDVNREGNNLADGNTRISTYMATYGASWTFALDTSRTVTRAYGIQATPTHFIIDKNGNIVDSGQGIETVDELVARLSDYW